MYEYLDRKPEAGDIVECQTDNINSFSKNKLYICKKLEGTTLFTELDDKSSTTNGLPPKHFKVVKTKSGLEAKVDDTCIWVEGPKIGQVFKATNAPKNGFIPYGGVSNANQKFVKVLCLANNKPKAYYKRSGEPWTVEEIAQIPNSWNPKYANYNLQNKWAYPSIEGANEYFPWNEQRPQTRSLEYNIVAFEDEFPSDEITVGSQWVRLTDYSTSKPKGEIVTIIKHEPVTKEVCYTNGPYRTEQNFLENFMPLHKYKQQNAKVVHKVCEDPFVDLVQPFLNQPTKPILKEKPMTSFQQLINSLFTEEIKTDYDKKPNFLVVIYNNEGTEIAQATADSIKQVEDKIQSTPKLWGVKSVIYSIDSEVQTAIPITTTKLKKSK